MNEGKSVKISLGQLLVMICVNRNFTEYSLLMWLN